MSKQTNSVENGSNNNQAAGNLTVINQNLGLLDTFIIEHLEQDLVPKLQDEAEKIKNSIGTQIREIVNQQVLNPLKRDLEIENINYHLSIIKEQIGNSTHSKSRENSVHENVERMELFMNGIESMEKIPKEEEELSRIWEGWYVDFYAGKKTSDLQFILNKMRDLTSKEAITLLNLNEKTKDEAKYIDRKKEYADRKNQNYKKPLFYPFVKPIKLEMRKELYLYEQLIKKELIEKDTSYKQLILPLSMFSFCIVFLYVFLIFTNYDSRLGYSIFGFLEGKFSTLSIVVFFAILTWTPYFLRRIRVKYIRTWIGEEIVSYARKIKIPKNNTERDSE